MKEKIKKMIIVNENRKLNCNWFLFSLLSTNIVATSAI